MRYFRPEKIGDGLNAREILRFASFLALRFGCNFVAALNKIETIPSSLILREDMLVVLPDAIASCVKFPELVQKLKDILRQVKKVIVEQDWMDRSSFDRAIELFKQHGVFVEFSGQTGEGPAKSQILILSNQSPFQDLRVPDDFQVVALMAAYNEEDVIVPAIRDLIAQGVQVFLIDNRSTDRTAELASQFLGKGLLAIEQFPDREGQDIYDWGEILSHKAKLSQELQADWLLHVDVDEMCEAPWQGVSLREALYAVDRAGFNAIDFTVINFPAVDNDYAPASSLRDHFQYFEFGKGWGHFHQVKGWKKTDQTLDLRSTGGHEILFSGRKIYPYKFLLRHYPFRSQAQAEKKIFLDRLPRFAPNEREAGWHHQYDQIKPGENHLVDPASLIKFDETFYQRFIIERLSGIGITRDLKILDEPEAQTGKDGLYDDPNRYSTPFSLEDQGDALIFHGYQEIKLTRDHAIQLESHPYLVSKAQQVDKLLSPYLLKQRSFMDIGANAGYYCYLALNNQTTHAIAVEMDRHYTFGMQYAKQKFGLDRLEIVENNFENCTAKAEVVLALSIIHWCFSCTASFGSLDSVIKKFADLTEYALIIEWVDTSDPAIQFFQHTQWNGALISEPYTFAAFERALNKYFHHTLDLGPLSATRRLFLAYKNRFEISYDAPFPFIEGEKLLSSKILTPNGPEIYWSQVYEGEGYILKQASFDLASREGEILQSLPPGPFPRVLDIRQHDGYSSVKLARIEGETLDRIDPFSLTRAQAVNCARQLLEMLRILRENGLNHRDIHPSNLIFSPDENLYLLDFGWAVSEKFPYLTPVDLAYDPRLPDGTFSDTYSAGKVIKALNQDRFPELSRLAEIMANRDHELNISSLETLGVILDATQTKIPPGSDQANPVVDLITVINRQNQKLNELYAQQVDQVRQIGSLQALLSEKDSRIHGLEGDAGSKSSELESLRVDLAEKIRQIGVFEVDYAQKSKLADAFKAELEERIRQIGDLGIEYAQKVSEADILRAEVAEKMRLVSAFEIDYANKSKQADELKAELESVTRQLGSLGVEYSQKVAEADALRAEAAEKVSQVHALEIDYAHKSAQLEALRAEAAGQTAQLEALRAEAAGQSAQIAELVNQNQVLQVAQDMLEGQIAALQADLKAKDEEIEVLQVELDLRGAQSEGLQSSLDDKKARVEGLQAEIVERDQRIASLESERERASALQAELDTRVEQIKLFEIDYAREAKRAMVAEERLLRQDIHAETYAAQAAFLANELAEIKNSKVWKVALNLRKIREVLIPRGSGIEKVARKIWRAFKR